MAKKLTRTSSEKQLEDLFKSNRSSVSSSVPVVPEAEEKAEEKPQEEKRAEEKPAEEKKTIKKPAPSKPAVKKELAKTPAAPKKEEKSAEPEKKKGRPRFTDRSVIKKSVTITVEQSVLDWFDARSAQGDRSREMNLALKAYMQANSKTDSK